MSSDESDYNRAADMHRAPLHTPQQMAALLLDLYTFLTTLHFDPADLKVALADGWPERFRYKEAMAYLLPVVEDIAEDNDDRWWMDCM